MAYNDDNVITGTLLETEVCAIDVKSCQLHKFGELEGHTRRCYLIFDGIHYDALEGSAGQRTFLPADVAAETAAIAFCEKQREKRMPSAASLRIFTLRRCLRLPCTRPLTEPPIPLDAPRAIHRHVRFHVAMPYMPKCC